MNCHTGPPNVDAGQSGDQVAIKNISAIFQCFACAVNRYFSRESPLSRRFNLFKKRELLKFLFYFQAPAHPICRHIGTMSNRMGDRGIFARKTRILRHFSSSARCV